MVVPLWWFLFRAVAPAPIFRGGAVRFRILCVPLALYYLLVVCWGIALLEINS